MLCNKEQCTGCFACYNVCPKNAITMEEDELGYIYPKINENKCVSCGLCSKACASLNSIKLSYPKACYAAIAKNKRILRSSTSGGIATVLAKKIIDDGGSVYGASYVANCEVNHIRIESTEELSKLQGSKYVHSYIKDCFKNVKKDLLNNKKVLFIGTPCQIAGLRRYLNKDYDCLYLVDLICHGVPSQKFLQDEVIRINKTINIDRVNFRDKQFTDFVFSIDKDGKVIYSQEWQKSPYFYTFMKAITYRENCYTCYYAKPERCSDITIGDFWGLNKDSKFYESKDKGVSVMLPITNKGMKLIESIQDKIDLEERTTKEAVEGNSQLKACVSKDKTVDAFKQQYKNTSNFFVSYKRACKKHYYKEKIKSNFLVNRILILRNEVKNGQRKN